MGGDAPRTDLPCAPPDLTCAAGLQARFQTETKMLNSSMQLDLDQQGRRQEDAAAAAANEAVAARFHQFEMAQTTQLQTQQEENKLYFERMREVSIVSHTYTYTYTVYITAPCCSSIAAIVIGSKRVSRGLYCMTYIYSICNIQTIVVHRGPTHRPR